MITVYTTKTCAYCPMVKKYLDLKKVEYREIDVTEDNQAREMIFKKYGYRTVPITVKGDRVVAGWFPNRLAQLVNS